MLKALDADSEQSLVFVSADFPEPRVGSRTLVQVTLVANSAPSPSIGRDSSSARYSLGLACALRIGQVTLVLGSGVFFLC